MHFYELLKQYEIAGSRELTIDELREKFELKDKYKLFNNLRVRVIEPSIKEINECTDLSVCYTQITKGRKVIALKFSILNKNRVRKVQQEKEQKNNSSDSITAIKAFNMILKNSLLNDFLKHGESIEDVKNRIISDFKSDKKDSWIEILQEKGLIEMDECPF